MKKFQFRLQTLLEVRERVKETKEQELSQITHKLQQLFDAREALLQSKEEHLMAQAEAQQGKMDVDTILWFQQYSEWLDLKIAEATKSIEETSRKREEKRRELVHATQECEIITKLKERDYKQYLKEIDREENLLIDELATSRFNRKE